MILNQEPIVSGALSPEAMTLQAQLVGVASLQLNGLGVC